MVFDTHIFIDSLHPHSGKLGLLKLLIDNFFASTHVFNPEEDEGNKIGNEKYEGQRS